MRMIRIMRRVLRSLLRGEFTWREREGEEGWGRGRGGGHERIIAQWVREGGDGGTWCSRVYIRRMKNAEVVYG